MYKTSVYTFVNGDMRSVAAIINDTS